jgi:hypothetical protein
VVFDEGLKDMDARQFIELALHCLALIGQRGGQDVWKTANDLHFPVFKQPQEIRRDCRSDGNQSAGSRLPWRDLDTV